MSLLSSRTSFNSMSVYEHLVAADAHLGEAIRSAKSKLAREDIRDAQFKIADALTHENTRITRNEMPNHRCTNDVPPCPACEIAIERDEEREQGI